MEKFKTDFIGYTFAKKAFGNYVFNRKDENGYFLKLSRGQKKIFIG